MNPIQPPPYYNGFSASGRTGDSDPMKQQPTSLKLCFCPLCDKQQMLLERQPLQWIFIARLIVYSLKHKYNKRDFFTLQGEVQQFIIDHWYFFSKLEQFRVSQEQWTNTLNEQFNNIDFFTLSDDKLAVRLNNDIPPWDYEPEVVQEISASSHIDDIELNQNTEQIQAELKESYLKTLQIAKVAYLTCQKALYVYSDDNSKNNIIAQMEELQKVINETNYLLGCFQK
ncbi:hypothetical protein EDI_334520 [Entamoeba dispar SAW760]|uniref:Uncharacterized protein n=1 Tax=Entamoeba dispar (strain ATCC PRA-260 / SAW760) TaxID=370354 RepID=B0EUK7_ENTDS|nr:uncharacterized protein EDI_334520 [Entamoeba dispar SAW760]EDR21783.1 hypothetical protein EDI_334520 [Entamoeba dispar SAW760]|eukprot:EDR21783.1 hypothetical protein EDI_334520 [Entamoeba dispar SAW760]